MGKQTEPLKEAALHFTVTSGYARAQARVYLVVLYVSGPMFKTILYQLYGAT